MISNNNTQAVAIFLFFYVKGRGKAAAHGVPCRVWRTHTTDFNNICGVCRIESNRLDPSPQARESRVGHLCPFVWELLHSGLVINVLGSCQSPPMTTSSNPRLPHPKHTHTHTHTSSGLDLNTQARARSPPTHGHPDHGSQKEQAQHPNDHGIPPAAPFVPLNNTISRRLPLHHDQRPAAAAASPAAALETPPPPTPRPPTHGFCLHERGPRRHWQQRRWRRQPTTSSSRSSSSIIHSIHGRGQASQQAPVAPAARAGAAAEREGRAQPLRAVGDCGGGGRWGEWRRQVRPAICSDGGVSGRAVGVDGGGLAGGGGGGRAGVCACVCARAKHGAMESRLIDVVCLVDSGPVLLNYLLGPAIDPLLDTHTNNTYIYHIKTVLPQDDHRLPVGENWSPGTAPTRGDRVVFHQVEVNEWNGWDEWNKWNG
jgi:hypothetical protein